MIKRFLLTLLFVLLAGQCFGVDYYVGGSGTDDGSHGTGTGSGAWASLEYALEDGGLTEDDTLYLEHTAGVFDGDVLKAGTNNRINVSNGSGAGRLTVTSEDATQVVVNIPSAVSGGSYLISPNGDMLIDNIKITNTNSISASGIAFFNTSDTRFQNFDVDMNDTNNSFPIRCLINGGEKTITFISNVSLYNCESGIKNDDTTHIVDLNILASTAIYDCTENTIISVNGMDLDLTGLVAYNTDEATFDFSGTGYAYSITESVFVKQNSETEEYVFNFADATAEDIYDGTTPLASVTNNIWWHTGTPQQDWNTLLYNATYRYLLLPISNRFVEPDGDAVSGWTWPADEQTNPAKSKDYFAFFGDSIMNGSSATTDNECFTVFERMTSKTAVPNDYSAISGLDIMGGFFSIDYMFTQAPTAPRYVFVSIGVNSLGKAGTINADIAEGIETIIQKIQGYGAKPIWLGVMSVTGSSPANTNPKAINALVETWCASNNVLYTNVLDAMEDVGAWETDYYDDLTTSLHPNTAGHAFIAQMAHSVFPYPRSNNIISIGGGGIGIW